MKHSSRVILYLLSPRLTEQLVLLNCFYVQILSRDKYNCSSQHEDNHIRPYSVDIKSVLMFDTEIVSFRTRFTKENIQGI
jgi:hypothetical protein